MRLSLSSWVTCGLIAAALVFYTDHLTDTPIGTFISYAAAAVVVTIGVVNYRSGVLGALLVLFTFPAFPRDILDIYRDLDARGNVLEFGSPKFITLAGFSLIIWMFLGLASVALFRTAMDGLRFYDRHVRRMFLFSAAFVTVLVSAAAVSALTVPPPVKEIVSDLRFPIMLCLGAMIGHTFTRSCGGSEQATAALVKLLTLTIVISGFKVLFFILDDRLSGGIFRLSFCNPFIVTFPFVLALVWTGSRSGMTRTGVIIIVLFGLAASLPDGRQLIFLAAVEFVGLFVLGVLCDRSRLPRLMAGGIGLVAVAVLLLIAIAASNPRFWNFLIYKSEFLYSNSFYKQLEKSPAVRIAEFKNIVSELSQGGIGVIAGKGAGGAFTYKTHAIPWHLGRDDYSAAELASGRYYRPHLFVSYWLLKGGIIGLLFYVGLFIWMGRRALARMRTDKRPFPVLMALLVPAAIFEAYWLPDFTIILSIFISVLVAGVAPGSSVASEYKNGTDFALS